MDEPRWPDDVPPSHAALYRLGRNCLEEVNASARRAGSPTMLEQNLFELHRSQALAITALCNELLQLRAEFHDLVAANDADAPWWRRAVDGVVARIRVPIPHQRARRSRVAAGARSREAPQ